MAAEREREEALGDEATLPVEVGIETRISVGIGDVDPLPRRRHFAGNSLVHPETDLLDRRSFHAGGDAAEQLPLGMIAEEHRRPLAVEDVGRCGGDLGEERIEVDRHTEGTGDVEDLFEIGDVPVEVGDASVFFVPSSHVTSTAKR